MTKPMTSRQVLDREFLEIRAKILELAASFDRLDRGAAEQNAQASLADDARLKRIDEALALLRRAEPRRAEQVQMIFSREYDNQWPGKLEVAIHADRQRK
jgi:hypothetical protein